MAFKRWNKSPSKIPPEKTWTSKEMKIIGWCLNKKIGVGISPDWKQDLNMWKIEINVNSKIHIDPNTYKYEAVYKLLH